MGGNEPTDGKSKNIDKSKKPEPVCECCCKADTKADPEWLSGENIFENRSCTDCCMWPFYIIFVIGWIVIISVASATGDPARIIKPENYRGQLCGEKELIDVPVYWVPLPSRPKYGYCVANCPNVGDVVCNNDKEADLSNSTLTKFNHEYTHTAAEFKAGAAAALKCKLSCSAAEQVIADKYITMQVKLKEKKCFPAFYPSGVSLLRCIPGKEAGAVNTTLSSLANESATTITDLGDTLGVGSFFQLGFAEVQQTWRVILICAFTGMVLSFIWIYLLQWLLAPIVYFCMILVLGVLIGLGYMCLVFADDLEKTKLPGEGGTEDQVKMWRAGEYICFLAAAIYFVIVLVMLKQIRIAIAIMKEASKAFLSAPSMGFVPIFTFIVLIGWVAFFVVTTVYIQTMGSDGQEKLTTDAKSALGDTVNVSDLIASNPNSKVSNLSGLAGGAPTINVTQFTTLPETKVLHLFNFFMILWTGNVCLMFGFMIMAMTVTQWYFSASQQQVGMYAQLAEKLGDDEEQIEEAFMQDLTERVQDPKEQEKQKKINMPKKEKACVQGVVLRSTWAVFANHFGTVIFGSLLIAIVQFIRAVLTYLADKYLRDAKVPGGECAKKVILYCIDYCLAYIEKVVKIISKNAFIVTAIKNTSFCISAFDAVGMLIMNVGRVAILTGLSTVAITVIKIFIVGINFMIGYGLMTVRSLTEDKGVESGLFPMALIFILSWVVASLFLNVYEACVDTIFMCFLIDESELDGRYMPEALASIVGVFTDAEDARQAYEKNLDDQFDAAANASVSKKE